MISALTSVQLPGEFLDRLLGCRVCGDPHPLTYEISLLAEEDGEICESSVLQLLHFCESCAALFINADWEALSRRSGSRA
jgi:hypothetical protein